MANKIIGILLYFNIFFSLSGHCQNFSLERSTSGKNCSELLYTQVDCIMKLKTKIEHFNLAKIDLAGDSLVIRKMNDSIYIIRPIYFNSEVIIGVIDKNSNKIIDNILIRSDGIPFIFAITQLNLRDIAHSYKDVFTQMKSLYYYSKNPECTDYTRIWRVSSYELALKRGDSSLLKIRMQRSKIIPATFKQNLIKEFQKGDILMAQNILLKSFTGEYIRVDGYGLYKW